MTKLEAKKKIVELREQFGELEGDYRGHAAVTLAMDIAEIVEEHPELEFYKGD